MQHKRIQVLNKIEKLNHDRCDNCKDVRSANSDVVLCECPAATEIRDLGDKLLKLTAPRPWGGMLKDVSRKRKLTVKEYIELRKSDVDDVDILRAVDAAPSTFKLWKSDNNLEYFDRKSDKEINLIIKERGNITVEGRKRRLRGKAYSDEVRKEALRLKERMTYAEVTKKTGIPTSTLKRWVYENRRKNAV